jgi:DNA-binding NarL/FixJ family response regulator
MGRTTSTSTTTKLVIADDHPLFREALRRTLGDQPDLEVVAEAADGHEALELCRRFEPELVLMDLRMPTMDGCEATQAIKRELPSTIVLVLTAFEDPHHLLEALKAGASGYLLKDASGQEIVDAIRTVLEGGAALNQEVAMGLFTSLLEEKQQREARSSEEPIVPRRTDQEASQREPVVPQPLTPREVEVVSLLAQGQTNQQIAQALSLSVSTVKHHVHHIIQKLGVSDRIRAVALAIEHRLIAIGAAEVIEGTWLVELLSTASP